ncbi:MAG: FecR family protein [Panacagrimonas sp.]
MKRITVSGVLLALGLLSLSALAQTAEIARFKQINGAVWIERGEDRIAAAVGMGLVVGDRVVTGKDGRAGLSFADNSRISLAPRSQITVSDFAFDATTHEGRFETRLQRGKMAVVSGKLAKQHRDAMKVRTPRSVLAVRGTEFVVDAGK